MYVVQHACKYHTSGCIAPGHTWRLENPRANTNSSRPPHTHNPLRVNARKFPRSQKAQDCVRSSSRTAYPPPQHLFQRGDRKTKLETTTRTSTRHCCCVVRIKQFTLPDLRPPPPAPSHHKSHARAREAVYNPLVRAPMRIFCHILLIFTGYRLLKQPKKHTKRSGKLQRALTGRVIRKN